MFVAAKVSEILQQGLKYIVSQLIQDKHFLVYLDKLMNNLKNYKCGFKGLYTPPKFFL